MHDQNSAYFLGLDEIDPSAQMFVLGLIDVKSEEFEYCLQFTVYYYVHH